MADHVRRANLPVFEALYKSVKDGSETRRSLEFNSRKTYRQDLQKELDEIDQQEIWRAGKTVRALRVSYERERQRQSRSFADISSPMPPRTRSKRSILYVLHLKDCQTWVIHCSPDNMHDLTIRPVNLDLCCPSLDERSKAVG